VNHAKFGNLKDAIEELIAEVHLESVKVEKVANEIEMEASPELNLSTCADLNHPLLLCCPKGTQLSRPAGLLAIYALSRSVPLVVRGH